MERLNIIKFRLQFKSHNRTRQWLIKFFIYLLLFFFFIDDHVCLFRSYFIPSFYRFVLFRKHLHELDSFTIKFSTIIYDHTTLDAYSALKRFIIILIIIIITITIILKVIKQRKRPFRIYFVRVIFFFFRMIKTDHVTYNFAEK